MCTELNPHRVKHWTQRDERLYGRRQALLLPLLSFDGLGVHDPLRFAFLTRVPAISHLLTRCIGLAPRDRQRSRRIVAQRERLAPPLERVVQPPAVRAAFHEEQQVQAITVRQPLARIAVAHGLDGGVRGNEVAGRGSDFIARKSD